jgi:hypothetical protein
VLVKPPFERTVIGALLLCVLAACGSVQTVQPPGFDLTGHWRLVTAMSDPTPRAETPDDIDPMRAGPPPTLFQPRDFPLLGADELVIEQDRQSMGIEYVGIGYRDISFGERKWSGWKITAGWNDQGALEVRMKRGRVRYAETYSLAPDRNRLAIRAVVDTQRGERQITRTFTREPAR